MTDLDCFLANLQMENRDPMARNRRDPIRPLDMFARFGESDDLTQPRSIFAPAEVPKWQSAKSQATSELLTQINDTYYKLINIPDVMAKRSAFELSPTTAGPIKTPFGPEVGAGYFSINWMIQSYAQKIPFEFAKWEDTVTVVKWLDAYVTILENDLKAIEADIDQITDEQAKQTLSEAQTYYHMAKVFLDVMRPISVRLQYYYTHDSSKEQMMQIQNDARMERIGLKPVKPRANQDDPLIHLRNVYNRTR